MKPRTILFFTVIIFCLFIASGVFAGNEKEASGTDKGVALKADGAGSTRSSFLHDDSGLRGQLPALSVAHSLAGTRHYLIAPSAEAFKVLSLMKKRVTDKELLNKIRDKLPSLGEDRLRMLASLSEEIDAENRSAKTDFAFLVLTTLIIFS
jgi:hypothetical protein